MIKSIVKSKFNKILSIELFRKLLNFVKTIYSKLFRIILDLIIYKYSSGSTKIILKTLNIESRIFDNIENYTKEQPQKIEYLNKNRKELYYSPPNFDYLNNQIPLIKNKIAVSEYAAILNNVEIIGGSNLILLDKVKVLYDLKNHDKENRYKYTDGAIIFHKNEHCIIKHKKTQFTFDKAIFLSGNFSFNYYHFLFEILVKFQMIEKLAIDINIPLIVDKISLVVPQYSELLSLLNKDNRRIIGIDKGKAYSIGRLYYFSCPNIIPPNYINDNEIKAEDILFNISSLNYLRKNLLKSVSNIEFPKRIFISRKKASGRRLFNEDEIIKLLEEYGFKNVYPEDYSIAEQIAMFNRAEFIAGGSGAAFTNLIFCNSSCKVIIFVKNELPFSGFSTLGSYTGIKMIYISGHSDFKDMKDIHEAFKIDIDKLKKVISEWL